MTDAHPLEEERDYLLGALRDLDEERAAGAVSDDEYRSLRDGYTARAADVLRRIDAAGSPPAAPSASPPAARPDAPAPAPAPAGDESPAPPSAPGRRRPRRRLRLVVATVGVLLFGAGAGVLLSSFTGSRQQGQTATGNSVVTPNEELAGARRAMAHNDPLAAIQLYDAVLAQVPGQPEALAYRGWLERLAGDADNNPSLVQQGIASLRAAVASDPTYPDARFFLGMALLDDAHDPAGAVTQLEAYLADHPPPAVVKSVQPVLARAKQEAAAGG